MPYGPTVSPPGASSLLIQKDNVAAYTPRQPLQDKCPMCAKRFITKRHATHIHDSIKEGPDRWATLLQHVILINNYEVSKTDKYKRVGESSPGFFVCTQTGGSQHWKPLPSYFQLISWNNQDIWVTAELSWGWRSPPYRLTREADDKSCFTFQHSGI